MTPKAIYWNAEKDEWLRQVRRISFEEIEAAVRGDGLLADLPHSNPGRFPSQRILIVEVRGETYMAPDVQDERSMFLKTIYPGRKARRKYGRRQESTPQD